MNKIIKTIVITLFVIITALILSVKILTYYKYSIDVTKNDGKIKIPVSNYNFGSISYKDSVMYDFKILNVGKKPIILNNIVPSCNCTALEYKRNIIQPADFLIVKAKFKPKNQDLGKSKITVFLSGNFEQENLDLTLEGNVIE